MELIKGVILTEEEASALLNLASLSPISVDAAAERALRKLSAFVTKHTSDPVAYSNDSETGAVAV